MRERRRRTKAGRGRCWGSRIRRVSVVSSDGRLLCSGKTSVGDGHQRADEDRRRRECAVLCVAGHDARLVFTVGCRERRDCRGRDQDEEAVWFAHQGGSFAMTPSTPSSLAAANSESKEDVNSRRDVKFRSGTRGRRYSRSCCYSCRIAQHKNQP